MFARIRSSGGAEISEGPSPRTLGPSPATPLRAPSTSPPGCFQHSGRFGRKVGGWSSFCTCATAELRPTFGGQPRGAARTTFESYQLSLQAAPRRPLCAKYDVSSYVTWNIACPSNTASLDALSRLWSSLRGCWPCLCVGVARKTLPMGPLPTKSGVIGSQ